MNVILLDKIANLGNLGDKVNVKAGYARNHLIPHGKAVVANPANIEIFEGRRAELEAKLSGELGVANERAEKINALEPIVISVKAGEEGKLFGSIGTRDISDAVTAAGVELAKSEVRLPQGAIRAIGDFNIEVQLHSEVKATVKLAVTAEI